MGHFSPILSKALVISWFFLWENLVRKYCVKCIEMRLTPFLVPHDYLCLLPPPGGMRGGRKVIVEPHKHKGKLLFLWPFAYLRSAHRVFNLECVKSLCRISNM